MSSEEKSPGFEPAIVPTLRPGKAGGVRAKNRQERTEALCRAGLRLFRERGLAQATVDEITREAGVSKGSFYRYFTDKAALVAAIFAPLEQQMDEAMERCRQAIHAADDDEALRAAYGVLAQTLAVMIFGSAEVVELYLQESRGADDPARAAIHRLSDKLTEAAVGLTTAAHDRGLVRDVSPVVTAVAVVGAVEAMLSRHFRGQVLGDPVEVTAELIQLVLEGIRAE